MHETKEKSLHVPPGYISKSGYVRAHRIRIPNKSRVAIGDIREKLRRVQREYEKLRGENTYRPGYQLRPLPVGYWERDEDGASNFVIMDGRHRVYALMLLGFEEILVEWNEPLEPEEK